MFRVRSARIPTRPFTSCFGLSCGCRSSQGGQKTLPSAAFSYNASLIRHFHFLRCAHLLLILAASFTCRGSNALPCCPHMACRYTHSAPSRPSCTMAIRADTNVCAAGWERGRADENKASLSGLTRTRCEFYASKSCKSMMGVCDVRC